MMHIESENPISLLVKRLTAKDAVPIDRSIR